MTDDPFDTYNRINSLFYGWILEKQLRLDGVTTKQERKKIIEQWDREYREALTSLLNSLGESTDRTIAWLEKEIRTLSDKKRVLTILKEYSERETLAGQEDSHI